MPSADPGTALARPNRHPVPTRQARRPHHHARRPGSAYHHQPPQARQRRSHVARQCPWRTPGPRAAPPPDRVPLHRRRQPVRPWRHHRHLQGPDRRRAADPAGHRRRSDRAGPGRNCLVLTNWTAHLDKLADALLAMGHDPVILRGGMGAKARAAALARLQPQPGGPPLLVVATGPYAGEGFDCPALDTLFLAAPVAQKGRLVQYAGRILRPYDDKATAEVHDYHDELTGVLASSLAKRAPGYTSLGFPDPRRLPYTPSANAAASSQYQSPSSSGSSPCSAHQARNRRIGADPFHLLAGPGGSGSLLRPRRHPARARPPPARPRPRRSRSAAPAGRAPYLRPDPAAGPACVRRVRQVIAGDLQRLPALGPARRCLGGYDEACDLTGCSRHPESPADMPHQSGLG